MSMSYIFKEWLTTVSVFCRIYVSYSYSYSHFLASHNLTHLPPIVS